MKYANFRPAAGQRVQTLTLGECWIVEKRIQNERVIVELVNDQGEEMAVSYAYAQTLPRVEA